MARRAAGVRAAQGLARHLQGREDQHRAHDGEIDLGRQVDRPAQHRERKAERREGPDAAPGQAARAQKDPCPDARDRRVQRQRRHLHGRGRGARQRHERQIARGPGLAHRRVKRGNDQESRGHRDGVGHGPPLLSPPCLGRARRRVQPQRAFRRRSVTSPAICTAETSRISVTSSTMKGTARKPFTRVPRTRFRRGAGKMPCGPYVTGNTASGMPARTAMQADTPTISALVLERLPQAVNHLRGQHGPEPFRDRQDGQAALDPHRRAPRPAPARPDGPGCCRCRPSAAGGADQVPATARPDRAG